MNKVLKKFVRDKHPEEAKKYKSEEVTDTSQDPAQDAALFNAVRRDAENAITAFRGAAAANDLKLLATTAHGVKPGLSNISEHEAAKMAAKLEDAGKRGDTDYVTSNTEDFIAILTQIINKLAPKEAADEVATEDTEFLTAQLQIIKTACENYDDQAAFVALDALTVKAWKPESHALIEKIRNLIYSDSDFDGVVELVDALEAC